MVVFVLNRSSLVGRFKQRVCDCRRDPRAATGGAKCHVIRSAGRLVLSAVGVRLPAGRQSVAKVSDRVAVCLCGCLGLDCDDTTQHLEFLNYYEA